MRNEFSKFQRAIMERFEKMKGGYLFRTDISDHYMWKFYLDSFPEGSNPMFRERTEHDCSACAQFIKSVGNVVAVEHGDVISLWDCDAVHPYDEVARKMSTLVKSAPIKNIFLSKTHKVGVKKNFEETEDGVLNWEHFYLEIPNRLVQQNPGPIYAEKAACKQSFERALKEITNDSIEIALDLIAQGSLYRGEENRYALEKFLELKKEYEELDEEKRSLFVWRQDIPPSITKIRNTAIGTLLLDLDSDGLDDAVRKFESKVAPQNYQRSKSLVTRNMVQNAKKTVEELGYLSALERRLAKEEDISVNDVLFANRDARKSMNASVFDELISEIPDNPKNLDKVENVPIEKFITKILPKASTVELFLDNRHEGNLVTLVAPVNNDAKLLFKWPNNFSWAYNGDVTDSIKERVKSRGGVVDCYFRASLSWFNLDDLDIHLIEPDGREICFSNTTNKITGGKLDVDMNVESSGPKTSRNAVENIYYKNKNRMKLGNYRIYVHNYTLREDVDVGFVVEIEYDGVQRRFSYDKKVGRKCKVDAVNFSLTKDGIVVNNSLPETDNSKEVWGLNTQKFHPVSIVMLSPNHWDGHAVGNKHYFFILQDCKRDGSARGFFNEYLNEDLKKDRKAFEMLGDRIRTESNGDQLSGLGFSSTKRDSVLCRVTGAFTRTVNITF